MSSPAKSSERVELSVHRVGLKRWLGYPPGPQAIPALSVAGLLLAFILDRTIGFDDPSKLGDWLNLLSALILGWPAFSVLKELHSRASTLKAAAALRASAAATIADPAATDRAIALPVLSPPDRESPTDMLRDTMEQDVAKSRAAEGDYSASAVWVAYVGFVLLITASAGSLFFSDPPDSIPGSTQWPVIG